MLQAGLAVLIASLTTPVQLTTTQHGSTACVCAATAATGGRNAPGRARCSHCQSNNTSTADYNAAWLDSLRVCRKRGHRRQECSRQGLLFSSPILNNTRLTSQ